MELESEAQLLNALPPLIRGYQAQLYTYRVSDVRIRFCSTSSVLPAQACTGTGTCGRTTLPGILYRCRDSSVLVFPHGSTTTIDSLCYVESLYSGEPYITSQCGCGGHKASGCAIEPVLKKLSIPCYLLLTHVYISNAL